MVLPARTAIPDLIVLDLDMPVMDGWEMLEKLKADPKSQNIPIVVVTALGPAEKSLGTNVRVVYLHGALVWTALICVLAAAIVGLVGLLTRRQGIHYWSRVLGRTGLVFWITYLPLSLWAMQTNWNGLFLSEPRWRVAIIFAIGGLAIQIGITLLENPAWASALNLVFAVILIYVLGTTDQVMHPGSPIFSSGSERIQIYERNS